MPPPDHYGNMLLPVQPAGADEAPGDPLLDVLLSFFKAVINADAGAAWASVGVGKETDDPVLHTFAHDPNKGSFDKSKTPALYLYRASNDPSDWIAQDYFVRKSTLVLYWVPPEVISQQKRMRMTAFMNVIQSVLDNTLEPVARHPAWVVASDTDPRSALDGTLLWRYADIWQLDMGRSEWADILIQVDATGMGGAPPTKFLAVKTSITLGERNQGELPEDQDVHDVDVTLQTAASDITFGALDYLEFDFKLSVASVSPATGSSAGGTTLVLLGTGFKVDPPSITIDGVECTDVDVSAPGALTCVTPPGNALAGALDVVITNPDGDSATVAAAFTYVDPVSVDLSTWSLLNFTRTGTYPVFTFLETAANSFHDVFVSGSPAPIPGATSIRMTAKLSMVNGRQWFWLNVTPVLHPDEYVYFNITGGVHGTITSGVKDVSMTSLGGGVWQVQATFSTDQNPYQWVSSFGTDIADNNGPFLGDVTKGVTVQSLIIEKLA